MSDPVSEGRRRRASPFWSIVVIFVVVMLGIAAYTYHDHVNTTGDNTTSGQATRQSPPAGNQP
jgi:hypothetical protein